MVSRVRLDRDLDERVARMVAPTVEDIVQQVRAAAAVRAPDGKEWLDVGDDRVRHTHRAVDGTLIPANVPYILPKPNGGTEPADAPRDPNLSAANLFNCRCQSIPVPGVVGESLRAETHVHGTRVSGRVHTDFERAGESEHARSGGGWLLGAARDVAAQQRAT